jgi:hypothetical protein
VRDIGSAAAVVINAAGEAVTQDEARFLVQHIGYRFLSSSIYLALRRVEEAGLLRREWGLWIPTRRSMGPILGLWRREDIDPVMERAATQAAKAREAWDQAHG